MSQKSKTARTLIADLPEVVVGLSEEELQDVSGGDPNYHECVLGTTAGGPPGLYPWYVECRQK